jgi:amidase
VTAAERDVIDTAVHTLSPDAELVSSVRRGERFSVRTQDASGGQIGEGVSAAAFDLSAAFPVVGPIRIEDVHAGDLVGVRLHSLAPATRWGHTWTRPGLGIGADVGFHVRRLDASWPVIDWCPSGQGIALDARPHVGTIGMLPAVAAAPRTLGTYGGNLDFAGFGPGATIWLTAEVAGGGLFIGDVHAAIGDAEVCGTGVEIAAVADLEVIGVATSQHRLPVVTTADRAWLIGVGDTLDEALAVAVAECVRRFADAESVGTADAYLAVGLLLDVTVCQVVNPRRSVAVTLGSGMDRLLRPRPAAAGPGEEKGTWT